MMTPRLDPMSDEEKAKIRALAGRETVDPTHVSRTTSIDMETGEGHD